MAHFAERLGFNLPNTLACDFELAAHFFQRAAVAVHQTKALFEHLAFAFGQGLEDVADLFFKQGDGCDVGGIFRRGVRNEVAKTRVVAFAHGRLKRDGLLRHFKNGADAFDGQVDFLGDFFRGGFAAEVLHKLLLHPHELVDRLDHV